MAPQRFWARVQAPPAFSLELGRRALRAATVPGPKGAAGCGGAAQALHPARGGCNPTRERSRLWPVPILALGLLAGCSPSDQDLLDLAISKSREELTARGLQIGGYEFRSVSLHARGEREAIVRVEVRVGTAAGVRFYSVAGKGRKWSIRAELHDEALEKARQNVNQFADRLGRQWGESIQWEQTREGVAVELSFAPPEVALGAEGKVEATASFQVPFVPRREEDPRQGLRWILEPPRAPEERAYVYVETWTYRDGGWVIPERGSIFQPVPQPER